MHVFEKWHTGLPLHPSVHAQGRRDGWGYEDTGFTFDSKEVGMKGSRYSISGHTFPALFPWAEKALSLNQHLPAPAPQPISALENTLPNPTINEAFVQELESLPQKPYSQISYSNSDRLDHAHGQTLGELYDLRYGEIKDCPDVIIWPGNHQHVETLVQLANKHNVGIIPYGGGTSVSLALQRPEGEKRMVISLDTKLMNRILEVNLENMTVVIEAGAVGQDLERELRSRGYCVGHEPDSLEFSTVGGWVATRASGMKKNVYGNIEDLVVNIKMVTASGATLTRQCQGPRVSTGPDLNHAVMGSEGMFGVITEVRLKLRPIPKVQIYGSLLLPNFEAGFHVMREVAARRIQPASIRLMDPLQFQLGHCLKPKSHSRIAAFFSWIQKFYITRILGFKQEEMVAITLLFEGDDAGAISENMKRIKAINKKYGGISAGSSNGERGYQMTYAIGYLRDFAMDYQFVTESFETAVPWDRALQVCSKVKQRIAESSAKRGIPYPPFITCRVTQTYDAGCCIYFYFGFVYYGMKENPANIYHDLESEARDEIEAQGGSLSHHHGIGKLRKRWMREAVSEEGIKLLKGMKHTLDPKNIFCAQNLIDVD